jgi:hypothetical protein
MKKVLLIFMVLVGWTAVVAQPIYMTRNGQISFFSKTSMENIDAVNNEVTSMLNLGTGEIVYAVLVKSFRFEKALMEEHFNENYMESDKFPKSMFSGKIQNIEKLDVKKDGTYPITVEGDLTVHGIKQKIVVPGKLTIAGGKVTAVSTFTIKLADYKIEIPSLVADKIAETIEIKVDCQYEPKV